MEEILLDKLKEEKDKLFNENQFDQEETDTSRNKFINLFDKIWNFWYKTQLDFQDGFSPTTTTQTSSQYDVTLIYEAFIDLKCFDYTLISHSHLSKQNYIYFLNLYRQNSPFPVYISVLKSNGPQCYRDNTNTSCATNFKLVSSNLKPSLSRQTHYSFIIIIASFTMLLIYRIFKNWRSYEEIRKISNENQQKTTDRLLLQQTPSNISNNIHKIDEKLEQDLRLWLEHEQDNGYQKLSEACRLALNNTFSKKLVSNFSVVD